MTAFAGSAHVDLYGLDLPAAARDLVRDALAELQAGQLAAVNQSRVDAELVRQIDHHGRHRGRPETHRRANLMNVEDEFLANPQHVLDRLLLELAGGRNAGVDEEVGRTMI